MTRLTHDESRDILGVEVGASTEQLRAAFRRLALEHHPDKGGDKEIFQKISAAYARLTKTEDSDGSDADDVEAEDISNVMDFFEMMFGFSDGFPFAGIDDLLDDLGVSDFDHSDDSLEEGFLESGSEADLLDTDDMLFAMMGDVFGQSFTAPPSKQPVGGRGRQSTTNLRRGRGTRPGRSGRSTSDRRVPTPPAGRDYVAEGNPFTASHRRRSAARASPPAASAGPQQPPEASKSQKRRNRKRRQLERARERDARLQVAGRV